MLRPSAGVRVWDVRVTNHFSAQMLLRIVNPRLHRVFLTWSGNVIEAKMQRVVLKRVVARLADRLLAVGFETWYTHVVEVRRQMAVVEAALSRWKALGVADAFENWMQAVLRNRSRATFVQSILVRMKQSQVQLQKQRREALLPAVLSKWLHQRTQNDTKRQ